MSKQFRPRLSEEEYKVVLAMREGWNPMSGEKPELKHNPTPAKILLLDIETAPLQSFTWGIWNQNISTIQIESDWFMLTWSAKWLFEDEVLSDRLTSEEAINEDDSRLVKSIWHLLDEADIVIAHNANKFDLKRLNTRFLMNKMLPPMAYQVIDTLEHVKKRFAITSNRLDYINQKLGLGRKIDTGGFELWKSCIRGDDEALRKMEEYNRVDVEILEETYLFIRPWIKPHPNIGLYIEENVVACPTCGSDNLEWHGKDYATTANLYRMFRCKECGSAGRDKKAIKNDCTTRSLPR